MSSTKKAAAWALLIVVTHSGTTAVRGVSDGGESVVQHRLLVRESDPDSVRFLPAIAFSNPSLVEKDGLRVRNAENVAADAAAAAAEEFARDAAGYPTCAKPPVPDHFGDNASPPSKSIQDLVSAAETAIIGRVSEIAPGWGVSDHRVVSLVELVVEGVLTDATQSLKPGDRVTYVQSAGHLRIGNRSACSDDYPGFTAAVRGSQVLFVGKLSRQNANHLDRRYVFPVRKGAVLSQPYPYVMQESVPVNLLGGALAPR